MNHLDQEGAAFIQELFSDVRARQLVRGHEYAKEIDKILEPTTVTTEIPAVVHDGVEIAPATSVTQFTNYARGRLEQEQEVFDAKWPTKVKYHKLGGISVRNGDSLRRRLQANAVEHGRDIASEAEDKWVEGFKEHENALQSQHPLGALSAQQAVEVIPEPRGHLVNIRPETV